MIGQAIGAHTNATHGMTLAAVSPAYYRHILPCATKKFARFAENVWAIERGTKTDEQLATEGLQALEAWMREIGVVMNVSELGVTPDMLEKIADSTFILTGGYKTLSHEEVVQILNESM